MTVKGIFYRREEVFRYLQSNGPATIQKIAAHFGLGVRGIQTSISQLREQKVKIYICDWKRVRVNGDCAAVYAVKEFPLQQDAPKPPPLTNSEKCRRYQQAKKAKVKNTWISSIFNVSSQMESMSETQ